MVLGTEDLQVSVCVCERGAGSVLSSIKFPNMPFSLTSLDDKVFYPQNTMGCWASPGAHRKNWRRKLNQDNVNI